MIKQINDLADVSRGASPRPIDNYLSSSGLPWLKISDISLGKQYVYETKQFIKYSGLSATKYVPKDTFVLTNSATPGIPFFLGKPMCLHDGFLYFENIKSDIDKKYLFYWFLAHRTNILTRGAGSIFTNLKADIVKQLFVDYPKLSVQHHIVNIMESVDDLITALNNCIAKYENIMWALMHNLFSKYNKKIKIGELCKVNRGSTITKSQCVDGNVPVIAGGKEPAYYNDKSNRKAPVITISGSGANAGYVNLYLMDIFASDCSTIEESDDYDIFFLYYYLLYSQNKIYSKQTGGAQPHIHPKDISDLEIIDIDKKEQIEISTKLNSMNECIKSLKFELKKYEKVKESLLNGLFTGKIYVPENYEEV